MQTKIQLLKILLKTQPCAFIHATRKCRSAKSTHPSADRNSQPIADALRRQVDVTTPGLHLLEIAAGSGQHAGFLAPLLPNITFQPTEFERAHFNSIQAYANDCPTKNILPPFYVDISQDPSKWLEGQSAGLRPAYDYMLNCNMVHITPFECTVGLFRAAGQLLKPHVGRLFMYGAYFMSGCGFEQPAESNIQFDRSLRARNPAWGVRDLSELTKCATDNGLELEMVIELPSNNKFLTWVRA